MPNEKSPEVLLLFPPLKPVTNMPRSIVSNISSMERSPFSNTSCEMLPMVGSTSIFRAL